MIRHFFTFQYLNLLLCVLVHFAGADKFGLVCCLVGFKVLSMLSDVGPGPHATDASDVDIHDTIEGIMPPFKNKYTVNKCLHVESKSDLGLTLDELQLNLQD